jgi:hypothetical protein
VKLEESTAISRPAMELTDRERDALACIRPGALAAFRRYLDAKWTLGLPAPRKAPEPVPGKCPRRLIS